MKTDRIVWHEDPHFKALLRPPAMIPMLNIEDEMDERATRVLKQIESDIQSGKTYGVLFSRDVRARQQHDIDVSPTQPCRLSRLVLGRIVPFTCLLSAFKF
jgi:hypothetical protein